MTQDEKRALMWIIGALCVGLLIGFLVGKRHPDRTVVGALSDVVSSPAYAQASTPLTREVLVTTTAVKMTSSWANRGAVEIQNLGPNEIWCGIGGSTRAVLNKSRRVDKLGGTWSVDLHPPIDVWCLAQTASQVTGAATIVNEVP